MSKPRFMYVLEPARPTFPDDITSDEQLILSQHFDYLSRLSEDDVVILAGRTEAAEMGIVVLQADSETAARTIVDNDPAVTGGIMAAKLYPFRLALLNNRVEK